MIKFVFFGSSRLSKFILEELEKAGLSPLMEVADAKAPLPTLPQETELCIVASFGKILPKELLEIPKYGFLNVHPSLLPTLRGPAPIQGTILGLGEPGVSIIKMDEQMDHGPILAQKKVSIEPWPDHYDKVEEKLAREGGKLLVEVLTPYIESRLAPAEQDHEKATYIKMIKKEDGLLDLSDDPEKNYRKVLAYSTWPGAYFFFKTKANKELRIVVREARVEDGKFIPTRVIPEGKREMVWADFLRGNA